jgi:hypothetical protein
MKTKAKRSAQSALKKQRNLRPLLSPLEQAILYGNGNPFLYTIGGQKIYISRWLALEFMKCAQRKMQLLEAAKEKDKQAINIPFKLRETFDDPRIILSLHPTLRNRLCRLECYSLFSIMLHGRKYFEDDQKFSKAAIKAISELFENYKCGALF